MNTPRFQLNITFEALHELMGLPEEVEIISAHVDWSRGILDLSLITPHGSASREGQENYRVQYSTPDTALCSPGELVATKLGLEKEPVEDNA